MLATLSPAQNEVIHLTPAERALCIEAVAPLVAAQRQAFGERLSGYVR